MSAEPSLNLPTAGTDTDIAIVGGGLSGTIAAFLLGRAGYRVTLIDRHREFPREFRVERIAGDQIEKLRRLGLLGLLSRKGVAFDHVVNIRKGHLLDRTHGEHYGIFYNALVEAIRAELPENVELIVGQVNGVEASAKIQRISILGHGDLTARLLVLATGMGDTLRRDLGITRKLIYPQQSLAFGFNLRPAGTDGFKHPALTYYGEPGTDGIDYLNVFPIADTTRANLFVFRNHRDPWVKALRERPRETLAAALPGLVKILGDFEVSSPVDSWLTDITIADNCRRDGVVLVGDAYQTSSPAAAIGFSRLLTDVEQLCTIYLPQWMASQGMPAAKIAAFYKDPEKRAMDELALQLADFRRRLTVETSLSWRTRRQFHFAWRRLVYGLDTFTPTLAGTLRGVKRRLADTKA